MFRNYLLTAYRNIKRQKLYSFINISGLAIGIACSLLVFLFVRDELTYDTFHEKADTIFFGVLKIDDQLVGGTHAPIGPALQSEFPEIISFLENLKSQGMVKGRQGPLRTVKGFEHGSASHGQHQQNQQNRGEPVPLAAEVVADRDHHEPGHDAVPQQAEGKDAGQF